jgi:hypothetical protein
MRVPPPRGRGKIGAFVSEAVSITHERGMPWLNLHFVRTAARRLLTSSALDISRMNSILEAAPQSLPRISHDGTMSMAPPSFHAGQRVSISGARMSFVLEGVTFG